MKCRSCGQAEMLEARENYRYLESGLPNVTLVGVTVRQCPSCGQRGLVIENISGLHKALAFAIADKSPRLTGDEVRFLRKYLGFSQQDFAEVVGVTPSTASRWESGKEPIGVPSDKLLRMMVFRERPIDEYPNERLADLAHEEAKQEQELLKFLLDREKNWMMGDLAHI